MKEIKCPHCGTSISIDDSTFAAVLEQVRNAEFNSEVNRRLAELGEQFKLREQAVRVSAEKDYQKQLSAKDTDMNQLRSELVRLQGVIDSYEAMKRSEFSEFETAKAKELFEALSAKDKQIADLESKIASYDESHKVKMLELQNANSTVLQQKDNRIIDLESKLEAAKLAATNRESELRQQHQLQLQDKEAEIGRLRDYRLRLSTKMVGENLEQHCSIKFEEAQSMGQFPDATFAKDNMAVDGTKGDFIFRDFVDGQEYVSIMFEMKNEMDATATKHRNDDFLDKLDKDRTRKGCEYAVLVSMLEQDNELYNNGIVDKSHRYPKMIVIRPQFFLPVLRLISESARKGFLERHALIRELETARNQSMDFAKFEDKINRFRASFGKSVTDAHKKFVAANEGIDKIIEALERQIKALREVKANFDASEQKLLKANEIADEDLTVKKLTYGNPTIRKMIDDAAKGESR